MATLTWLTPEKAEKKYCVYKKMTAIGAADDNDVVLKAAGVLPHHAHLVYDGKSFAVVGLEKGADLSLKGKKKTKFYLKDGDLVTVGSVPVRFIILDPSLGLRQDAAGGGDDLASARSSEIGGIRKLYEFARTLMEKESISEILDALVDSAVDVVGADKGFLIMMEGDRPFVKAARNVNRRTIDNPVEQLSDSVVLKVLETKQPLIINDALSDREFKNSESVLSLQLLSLMATPLMDGGKLVGIIYVGNDSIKARFDRLSLDLLTIFGAHAALILNKALVRERLRSDIAELKEDIERQRFGEIVGSCAGMQAIFSTIAKVATVDVPVLVTGETGTGKDLIAREVHARSPRRGGPFVAINCGAIPETLMESELFGYVKGAFTGAVGMREGKFHAADKGTIFLDEIGDLPLNLQVKLLRVLHDKEIVRVGANRPEHVDCRVVAATNKVLEKELAEGRFREDLYYRLNVVSVALPPLRERGEDIVYLASWFLKKYADELGRPGMELGPEAVRAVRGHAWPGNVRELQNRVKKAILMCDGTLIGPRDLGLDAEPEKPIAPLAVAREEFQKSYILESLRRNNGNRTKTAEELGVDPRTIFRYLEKEPDMGV